MATCFNRVVFYGHKPDLEALVATRFDFGRIRPIPPAIRGDQAQREAWCLSHWGTATQPHIYLLDLSYSKRKLVVEFITEDGPIKQLVAYICRKYPRIEAHHNYCDPQVEIATRIRSPNHPSLIITKYHIKANEDFPGFIEKVKQEQWATEEEIGLWYDV